MGRLAAWSMGVVLLATLIAIFYPENLWMVIHETGVSGVAVWMAVTIAARAMQAQSTVISVNALGYRMTLRNAFWIGWLRTFANQLVPASGVAAYAELIRRQTRMSWSELASLAAPQFVLAAVALGLLGVVATTLSAEVLGDLFVGLFMAYGLLIVVSTILIHGGAGLIRLSPGSLAARLERVAVALQRIRSRRHLLVKIVAFHGATILLRGSRLWLLFVGAGADLGLVEALLVVVVAESSLLIQLTPGGLGIREGAVLAGAMLVGIPAEVAAGVAVLDRLLVVAITIVLTPPAIVVLRHPTESSGDN